MDPTSEIQTFIILSFICFIGFASLIMPLIVSLQSKRATHKKAEATLKKYSADLESMVEERTAELRASEETYRNLFINSQEAIIIFNSSSSEIIDANSEATSLFGYSNLELLIMKIEDLNISNTHSKNGDGWEGHTIRRKDKTTRFIDCITGKINYAGIDCHQVICRDITVKRELESQLIQNQKMGALGQLAAGVAHELNTPLGAIYNSGYFIKEELKSPPSAIKKHLEIIENQIERCRRIIKDLLNFSRAPSATLDLKKTDLNELIERCLSLTEKEIQSHGINLIKNLEGIPLITIDPSRITQVFFNIILNAVHAMPSEGHLTIKSWIDSDTDYFLELNDRVRAIHISFTDTGIGIPKENLTEIFNPFFTTKKVGSGVGLGLSVAYEIVNLFKGNIGVESKEGEGTTFTVNLPFME